MNDHQDKNVMKTKLILTAALLIAVFSGCKKEKDLAVPFVVSNTAETVYITAARLEATFSYPGTKYVIRVDVSERQDMSEAVHYDVKVNGDRLTAEVTGLKGITTYYYRYINDTGFGTAGSGVKSFTTNDYSVPAVTTAEVSEITANSATCGGDITDDGCLEVTARGVCWGATQTPTVSDSHTSDGTGTGVFTSATTNLEPDTKYYIRAYATNAKGTGYGEVREFRTIENVVEPTVSTVEVKDVTALSAVAVGNVSSDGGAEIMSRGFCWSLSEAPTVDDHYVECEGATGSYEGLLAELEADETYHVRAFATNSAGTSYGEELTFTTSDGLPVVVTSSVTDITSTSAKCGGNVTDEGASSVTERGICWSTSQNPTVSNSHTTDGTGTGTFTSSMTGLTPNATYYVRAYAKNVQGISYGAEVSFEAVEGLPTVTTSAVTGITSTTATGGGNVTDEGASDVTERGICWSTKHNPTTTGNSHISSGSGAGSFTAKMTWLTPGTTYYVRAYAKNTQGVTYGNEIAFITAATMPTVTTNNVSYIAQTTATGGGNVTDDGGATVTARGVCWSTLPNPTVNNSHTTDGSGTGSFTSSITGLTANTKYYVRAYATNSAGTAYGEQKSFTTQQNITLPTVTTNNVSDIAQTTATGGGNVTNGGGAAVTARGICWSTSQNPTVSNSHTTDGTGTGTFTSSMTGLTANTTYYVRAYATNSAGTAYGEQKSFTTQQNITLPTVTTNNVSNIAQTTATGGGNVTNDGGATVTARGVCWSTSQNPTVSNSHTTDGTGTGTFTSSMTGLTANTTYYVRAYATNSAGTNYGNELSFTTQDDTGNYFCITALDAGTTTVSMAKEGDAPTVYLEYKKNNGAWTAFTVGSTNISLSKNDKVFFKAPNGQPNNKFANGYYANYNHFVIGGGNVDVSGNIMYLLDPTGEKITLASANSYAFACLFNGCNKLVSANQLLLPATTLADGCYGQMFRNCTSLTTAPDLPATTLASYCYYGMFSGCTSLTTAPDLPATTLAIYCYHLMFYGCTSLTTAPDLPATTLADRCYSDMFSHCTSLTAAPDLSVTTLAEGCYGAMFAYCTSLTAAPDLPATTLANDCYTSMFYGCTSLTTAPDLPATTLTEGCYKWMFRNCTSLTAAPDLPATTLADRCYYQMFFECTSLTTAPDLPATTLAIGCYQWMFYGCTSLTAAPDLPATTLAESCYGYMFFGCSNLHYIRMLATENLNATEALYEWVSGVPFTGDFYKKAGANLPNGSSGIPYGWTVHNE